MRYPGIFCLFAHFRDAFTGIGFVIAKMVVTSFARKVFLTRALMNLRRLTYKVLRDRDLFYRLRELARPLESFTLERKNKARPVQKYTYYTGRVCYFSARQKKPRLSESKQSITKRGHRSTSDTPGSRNDTKKVLNQWPGV